MYLYQICSDRGASVPYSTAREVAIYMLGRDIRKYAIFKNEFLFPDLAKYPEVTRLEKALEEFEVKDE